MQVPAILYGSYSDVKKRCRRAIKRCMANGQLLWEVLQADFMLDTTDHAGVIIVEPLWKGNDDNFHCYAPLHLLLNDDTFDQLSVAAKEAIFTAGLEEPWSLTCMFSGQIIYTWVQDAEHYRRYVLAVLRHWNVLDAEGDRYSFGSNSGERLWKIPTMLQSALAKLGVPVDLLRKPLPAGGLYALLAQADPAQAGDLVDLGKAHASSWRSTVPNPPTSPRPPVEPPPPGTFMSEQMSAAVEANDPAAVRRLIEAGEPIGASHESLLRSPILWAAEQGHTDLVRFLLDRGAAIEDQADEGETPLMLAAYGGHRDVVRLLLDRGANPYYVTDKGHDVLLFAEWGKDPDVLAMLKDLWVGKDPYFHYAEPDD